jgi:hypothetical protein
LTEHNFDNTRYADFIVILRLQGPAGTGTRNPNEFRLEEQAIKKSADPGLIAIFEMSAAIVPSDDHGCG